MKTRICVIGCGNISNTRHIAAIKKNNKVELVGLISNDPQKLKRTVENHSFLYKVDQMCIDTKRDIYEQLADCKWFNENIDACIIGTPPEQHFSMVKASLKLGKHVLVEKPMMMNIDQCDEAISIAKEKKLVFYVMHSFQFSNGMIKLKKLYDSGELGTLKSILELQLTNRDRRLPTWYNDLPLGLFYDEAAHFFYSAYKFGGELEICNANAKFNESDDNTPRFLEVQLTAGDVPVQMYMNFNSPICEWGLMLVCDKKIAIYDYFKDILIVLKNDGEHYAKDVFRTSVSFTFSFWRGFIKNGFRMISGKLLYGHDVCVNKFIEAINTGITCNELSSELGRKVVKAMNEVVENVRRA